MWRPAGAEHRQEVLGRARVKKPEELNLRFVSLEVRLAMLVALSTPLRPGMRLPCVSASATPYGVWHPPFHFHSWEGKGG